MKKNCLALLSAALLVLPSHTVFAGVKTDQDSISITTEKHILDNGLTVLISRVPASPLVSVYALVKTGSATEGKFSGSGISHFLEHMLFKGTKKREVGAISREVQALGGVINASTGFDYTIYTITVPQQGFDQALDIMADCLMNSQFDKEEIEKEREVIYGEMRMHKDRPQRYLSRLVFNTVYIRHPYRLPVIGHKELLKELGRDDFLEYYHKFYIPNNIILSVAGNVDAQSVLSKIRKSFKGMQRQREFSRNVAQEPQQISMRRYEEEYPTQLTRMSLSFAGVSILDEDMFALDVLAMILGQGESSRLHVDLFKKKQLVKSVSVSNFTPMDQGLFEVECVLEAAKIEATIGAVKEHIRIIAEKGIQPSELKKTKRQVLSEYIYGHRTSGSIAYSTAIDEAFAGDPDFSKKYVDAIRKVTSQDIKRVAREYLVDNKLSIVILRPQSEKETKPQKSEEHSALDIKKVVLPNGLTILLRENPAFPLVSINLVLNGGTRQESAESNGISKLTSMLWVKGTDSRTAETIAEDVESLGGSLSGFSGRNSFGIQLNVLSEDLDFGLDLLEDLMKNPSFSEQEFIKVKERIKTAIIAQKDSVYRTTDKALRETLFQTHPLRLEAIGTLESVAGISRQDILDFFNKLSFPGNMVLSVFGDFSAAQGEEILTKKLSSLKPREMTSLTHTELPPEATREATVYLDKKQAMVMVGFQGVDFLHKDRYGLEVLSSILGSSFSGRIFTRIRDELGQAYALGGGFLPGKDMGFLSFYVLTSDESASKVRDILLDLINEIREDVVGAQELRDMKSYLTGRHQMEIETDASLGFLSALDELYGMGHDHYQQYNNQIDSVTQEDIKRLAKKYLDVQKAAIVMARPKPEE